MTSARRGLAFLAAAAPGRTPAAPATAPAPMRVRRVTFEFMAADRTLSAVRRVALLLLAALAGCGSGAQHAARQRTTTPVATTPSHVFTIPAKLPPRRHRRAPATAHH